MAQLQFALSCNLGNATLEKEQAKIQADKKAAKADGTVTGQERAKLAHEQNKASRTIYRDKHNARTQQNTPPKQ